MKLFGNPFSSKKTDLYVNDAMNPSPITVDSGASVHDAIKILVNEEVGGLLVVNNGRIRGILTKTDLLEKVFLPKKDYSDLKVKDIMTDSYVSVGPEMKLSEAVRVMVKHDIRRLPVVSSGELQGLITQSDILVIQPNLIDSLIDKFLQSAETVDVRGLDTVKGSCDMCGSFSKLKETDNGHLCRDCVGSVLD